MINKVKSEYFKSIIEEIRCNLGELWNILREIKNNNSKNKCVDVLRDFETNANVTEPKAIAELFVDYF